MIAMHHVMKFVEMRYKMKQECHDYQLRLYDCLNIPKKKL